MSSIEDTIPREDSLEGSLEEMGAELKLVLDETYSAYNDILSVDNEIRRNIEAMHLFSTVMAASLADDPQEIDAASKSIYRSICFAAQTTDELLPEYYSCNLVKYVNDGLMNDQSDDAFRAETEEYFEKRPLLNDYVEHYLPIIDQSGRNNTLAKMMAGLVFKVSEISVAEAHIKAGFDNLSSEDFE